MLRIYLTLHFDCRIYHYSTLGVYTSNFLLINLISDNTTKVPFVLFVFFRTALLMAGNTKSTLYLVSRNSASVMISCLQVWAEQRSLEQIRGGGRLL